MKVTSIRIQNELQEPLENLAEEMQRSKNWVINEAVKEYITRQSVEAKKWKETLEAVDSVRNANVVDSQAVHAWLGSWGQANELKQPK